MEMPTRDHLKRASTTGMASSFGPMVASFEDSINKEIDLAMVA